MSSKLLPTNEHNIERVVRIVLGLALLAIVFVGPKTPFGWIGVLPLVTGLIGSCPAYTLFGFSTRKTSA
jgi:membrane protein implicated in regulation of membrane protease activity